MQAEGCGGAGQAPGCVSRDGGEVSAHPCSSGHSGSERAALQPRTLETQCARGDKPAQRFYGNATGHSWCVSSESHSQILQKPAGGVRPSPGRTEGPVGTGRSRGTRGAGRPLSSARGLAVPEESGAGVGIRVSRRNRTDGVSAGRPRRQGMAAGTLRVCTVARVFTQPHMQSHVRTCRHTRCHPCTHTCAHVCRNCPAECRSRASRTGE